MAKVSLDPSTVADLAAELIAQLKDGLVGAQPERIAPEFSPREDAERRKAAHLAARRAAEDLAIRSALPPVLRSYWLGESASAPRETPAVQAVRAWLATSVRGLLIRGPVDAGKTVAAATALVDSVRAGARSVSWHRPNDFVSGILHSYDAKAPVIGREFVVIDDIGRETKADFEEALCAFIDDRDARFVMTTNMRREDLAARYDERLLSRINDCAKAVTVKSVSMRKKNGVI